MMNVARFRLITCSIFLFLTFGLNIAKSQDLLTLEDAISFGLENNYNVQIFKNLSEIAANNHSVGNAGFLPTITGTATSTERVEDSDFSAGGESRSTSGARNSSRNMALNFNWTLFDGFQMFRSYDRLGVLQDVGDEELRLEMELLIANITLGYYNIIRINEQLVILENNIDVTEERILIEETKVDLGSGSEYDLLQAQSDLNADRAAYIRENNSLTEAKIALNQLLSRAPDTNFIVTDDISINRGLSADELYQRIMMENTELSIARMEKEISSLEIKTIRGERFPEISLTSGYSFNRSENDGGFIRFNESTGFSVGISARVNIFDGFNLNRRIDNAIIQSKNAEINYEIQKLRLESDFLTIFRAYQNSIELVDLEERNLENAEQTVDIALERFRLGSISSLELREAQRTFLQAENRLINAKFEAKIAEIELLQLSGDLGRLL
tara:strand:+ start:40225 stop:41553 length:1329 start_codon:yes stop_codon:yes gene_type:complete